jgi:hypothetical protein
MPTVDLTRDQSPPPRSRRNIKKQPVVEGSIQVIVTAQVLVCGFQRTVPLSCLPENVKTYLQRPTNRAISISAELLTTHNDWPYYGNRPIFTFEERMDILGWLQSIGYTPLEGYPTTITKYPALPVPKGVEDLEYFHQCQPAWQELPAGPVAVLNFTSSDDAESSSDEA